MHRDRLLEPLALGRLDRDTAFEVMTENQVETLIAIALADIADDPDDRAFVLLECLNLLIRDGQFARMKLLAQRLRAVAQTVSEARPYLRMGISAMASSLAGNAFRAASDLHRGLGPSAPLGDRPLQPADRLDLTVAAAIKMALVDEEVSFAERARALAINFGDGLAVSLLDSALAWHHARAAANPLVNLDAADQTFSDPDLADYVRKRGIEVLFPSQIAAVQAGLTSDDALTVSLPTSSGKTLLAEFKIVATLARHPGATIIYVAPYRLLSRQVTREFRRRLSGLGHFVQDIGSGYDLDIPGRFGDVLVCTPERFDALLRQAASDLVVSDALNRCRLVVFDEMHLIGRSGRGPRFEMLLTRLRLRYPNLGFLALSAASQGVDGVAAWLTEGRLTRGARRPTGTIEVAWRTDGRLEQRVERRAPTEVGQLPRSGKPLSDAAKLIARLSPDYRPALAVCTQRAYAESLATLLVEGDPMGNRLWIETLTADQADLLDNAVEIISAMMGPRHPLTHALRNGVGFHHAGVPALVLGIIENLAAHRVLRAVSATTTVAEGADLPFRAVVIPHLNFQSSTKKLERDLYLNIIGRAGRVNVAMEGIVFILDSAAATLQGYISQSLWTTAAVGRVQGQLIGITSTPRSPEESSWYDEFESQILGWLGDGKSYHDDQAAALAASTYTHHSGSPADRRYVERLTQTVLESLEQRGFAMAASPYRLTERGERARLTGLNSHSVTRLEKALTGGPDGWLPTLLDTVSLNTDQLEQIARTIFESTETMSNSLWLRRTHRNDAARTGYLAEFARGRTEDHLDSELFWVEIRALSLWIAGESMSTIADTMPTFGKTGLFSSSDESSRISDVAEYTSRIGYPGSWTWTAAHILARDLHHLNNPTWISAAIEFGAPTETAVSLMRWGGLSRPGALRLTEDVGPVWAIASETLRQDDSFDAQLTAFDRNRVRTLRAQLRDSSGDDHHPVG